MARQMPRSHTNDQLDAPVVPQDGAGARLGVGVLEASTFNREDMMGGGEGMCALLGGDVPCTRNTSLPLITQWVGPPAVNGYLVNSNDPFTAGGCTRVQPTGELRVQWHR